MQHDHLQLTERETNVLNHIAMGLNNEKIGKLENISVHTVKAHISSIIKKLNARNRTHAAFLAAAYHILDNT